MCFQAPIVHARAPPLGKIQATFSLDAYEKLARILKLRDKKTKLSILIKEVFPGNHLDFHKQIYMAFIIKSGSLTII